VAKTKVTPFVDPVRRFVLLTNAKCGSSTVRTWFFANLDLAAMQRRPLRFLRAFGPRYAWRHLRDGRHITPRDVGDIERIRRMANYYRSAYCADAMRDGRAKGFFTVAVVRHPESRVVSGYVDKICGPERGEPWVREVVEAGGAGGEISFDEFLGYLERTPDEVCNPHWRRQSYLLEDYRIDAWVRLERLGEDFRKIGPRVGVDRLDFFEQRIQSNPYDPAAADAAEAARAADMPAMGSREVIAWRERHGAFPPKDAFLTEATRARIRRIYARDFALLPYET
jgi:hypothetical protein